jgi:hypothetical protein
MSYASRNINDDKSAIPLPSQGQALLCRYTEIVEYTGFPPSRE